MIKEIIQFAVVNTINMVNSILNNRQTFGTTVVFDLEDGLQNVFDIKQSKNLKEETRNLLFNALNDRNKKTISEYGIRINALSSVEFYNDLKFLRGLNKNVKWKYVVVPKINSQNDVVNCMNAFSENDIKFTEFIPIIETINGFQNIKNIFSNKPNKLFHRSFWGQEDFNLDLKCWPLKDYTHSDYWETLKTFITFIENAGYHYINGPSLNLSDHAVLKKILGVVSTICHLDFDQVALSYEQVEFLLKIKDITPLDYSEIVTNKFYTEEEKIDLAEKILVQFQDNQIPGKSFSIYNGLIVSPHNYQAALNYLLKIKLTKC